MKQNPWIALIAITMSVVSAHADFKDLPESKQIISLLSEQDQSLPAGTVITIEKKNEGFNPEGDDLEFTTSVDGIVTGHTERHISQPAQVREKIKKVYRLATLHDLRTMPNQPSPDRKTRSLRMAIFTWVATFGTTVLFKAPNLDNAYDLAFALTLASTVATVVTVKEYFTTKYSFQLGAYRQGLMDTAVAVTIAAIGFYGPHLGGELLGIADQASHWDLVHKAYIDRMALSDHLPNFEQLKSSAAEITTYIVSYTSLSAWVRKLTKERYKAPPAATAADELRMETEVSTFEWRTFMLKQIFKNIFLFKVSLLGINLGATVLDWHFIDVKVSTLLLVAMNVGFLTYLDPHFLAKGATEAKKAVLEKVKLLQFGAGHLVHKCTLALTGRSGASSR